jgi:hypothetical protein
MLDEQRVFALPTTWDGEVVARAVFLHPDMPDAVVDDMVVSMA